ncbi:MAG: DUF2961 domain-containing protein [Draconibacterium sp.]|nr:DUF2961 domain-containing protein [Draconibacterium sp.]
MNHFFIFAAVISLFFFSSCKKNTVTLESLLAEMTDKTVVTYFPEKLYTLKQFSSYDRKSISPGNKNWWANADYTQFIREEENKGRREFVLLDAEGPGAIVRFWMTFAGEGASKGTMRIYIDKSEDPVIDGNVLDILSGDVLATDPLVSSVSPETEYQRRGHNLYLPLPYSQHCKITYECDAVKFENNRWCPSIYYNINYRTYKSEVEVESISKEVLERAQPKINQTSEILLGSVDDKEPDFKVFKNLAATDSLSVEIPGKGKAISKISVKLDAQDINQALRSTVLIVSFEGEKTVWIPVGEFFGTGYQISPSKTWYTKVGQNGLMEASWLMPFKASAQVQIINYGDQPVKVELEASTTNYNWKNSSMYFGASWHEYNQIYTAKDTVSKNHEWHFDVNYVDLTGQGIYVGDALTVFNTVDAWWGEGDEKIFVDGEDFPSCIGTGTEDYYGYAWCRPEKFTHPFIAQPTGAGNFHPGMTVNLRYRSLDAIPFTNELNSNIELWHWVKTKINYAMTAFWYAKPGFQSNVTPEIESVKIPVALKRSDIYKPVVNKTGKIEGEHLEVITFDSGIVSTQSGNFGWSGESQLWWRNTKMGDELITKFILNETGKFKILAQLTKAGDYGIVQLYLNGIPVGKNLNCFNETGVTPFEVDLGKHVLSERENIFS